MHGICPDFSSEALLRVVLVVLSHEIKQQKQQDDQIFGMRRINLGIYFGIPGPNTISR